jgi:hypothetical protein
MRRVFTIGFLAMALLLAALTPAGGRVAHSVRTFGRQLHPAASAQSISPIERFVMSLATIS